MASNRAMRPLGLSLAIVLTVLLFSIFPLLQISVNWLIQDRINQLNSAEVDFVPNDDESGVTPLAVGGNFNAIAPWQLVAQGALSLFFLIVAVFAWRGRPPWIRYLLFGSILLLTAFSGAILLSQMLTPRTLEDGVTSADVFFSQARCVQSFFTIIVPLYAVWYMNRAPARAFYQSQYHTIDEEHQGT